MLNIPFHIFSRKITILSHSHFISIEIADFPTVSPTSRTANLHWDGSISLESAPTEQCGFGFF